LRSATSLSTKLSPLYRVKPAVNAATA
jgi:hypothetical protein